MPDRANNKTKRRRKSKAKKKNNNNNNTATSSATVCDNAPVDELNVPDVCCDNPEPEPEPEPEPTNICDNETFEEHINKKFYKVESPDRELLQVKKANNLSKSKSLDDDDGPLNITEVTDHPENVNTAINESNAIVSEAESDVDWETTDELQSDIAVIDTAQGILSIETISLDCAEVEETNSLSPEEEKSLRMYLGTLNLATGPDQTAEALPRKEIHILDQSEKIMILKLKKARKKAEIENYSPTKPRLLDVIDEEGSNESSSTTRRDSFLKDTTYDDLEDDVFIDPKKPPPTPIEYFLMPKTRIRRSELNQAQECFLLGTKLVDSSVEQGCADWTIEKTDELRGAEVVYLDDSSSSTSEVYDTEGGDADIETEEESVRIQTPVIEFDMGDPVNVKENIMEDVFSLPEEIPVTCNEVILVATDSENDSGKETFSETKIEALKKELDDALKDLLENSDENSGGFIRQDSSSSVCSSQSTAKYNPSSSSLIDITTVLHDEVKSDPVCANNETFSAIEVVKPDVPYFPGDVLIQPSNLKDICVRKIASLPYGSAILEELASVAKSLELYNTSVKTAPDVPPRTRSIKMGTKVNPPLPPRQSSLHIAKEEQKWVGLVTKSDPSLLACLSPSQRQEIERSKKQPGADEAGLLIDMHTKYLDRRGYHEYITNGTHTSDSKNTDDKTSMQANRTTQAPRNDGFGNRLLAIIQDPSLKNGIAPHPLNNNSVIKNESIECSEHYTSEKSYKATISNKKQSTTDTKFETSATYNQSDPKKVEYSKTSSYSVSKDDEIGNLQRKRNFILDDPIFNRDKRRSSLPRDLYEKQMEYILRKEKEIEEEIKKLEADKRSSSCENKKKSTRKAPLLSDEEFVKESCVFDARKYFISRQGDVATIQSSNHADSERGKSVPTISSNEERFRQEMYSEYMDKVAEREERKQHKVIKITGASSGSLPILNDITQKEIKQTCGLIEEEFITKAKERWEKLGFKDPETEDEKEKAVDKLEDVYKESTVSERKKIKVIDGGEEKEIAGLPSHLREFVQFTANDTSSPETVMFAPTFKARAPSPAFWTPGTPTPASENQLPTPRQPEPPAPPPPPVWTPSSAEPSPQAQRKFRPVSFESPKLVRKIQQAERAQENQGPPPPSPVILNGSASQTGFHPPPPPPLTASLDRRLPTSHSAPCAGLNAYSTTSRLPKAQNPTITLLQKAREGQLPRGASYLSENHHSTDFRARKSTPPRAETGYSLRKGYVSEGEGEESRRRRMADVGHSKIDGVGPTTKDGMPVALRSEVKDQSKWYKKMYDTIHRNKYDGDYVTVRYKSHRGQDSLERARTPRSSQYAYFDPRSGYLSEPGGGGWSDAYESDAAPRRRRTTSAQLEQEEVHSEYLPSNKYSTLASAKASKEIYKNQPGKIENYVPGRSSVVEKESKQWWDEVMDIFDGWLDDNSPLPHYGTLLARAIERNQLSHSTLQPPSIRDKKDLTSSILSKSNMARALKESGYESDSTLVFRRRSPIEAPLSPDERRQAYRSLQAGGEPPLHGFRKPAPERPRDDAEIEYFPLSPTLTRIRVHRNIPQQEAAVCYPITKVSPTSEQVFARYKRSVPSFIGFDEPKLHLPPAPPMRQSSKASSTLRMVSSVAPKRAPTRYASRSPDDSNIKFLQNRIQNKLSHATMKDLKQKEVKEVKMKSSDGKKVKTTRAALSVSLSPTRSKTVPRIKPDRPKGTSSFAAPRRTLSPIEYSNPEISRYEEATGRRIPIEGGAGRRTPITGMLDRATYLDKYRASTLPSRLSRSVELKSSKVPYVRKQSPGLIVRNTTAMYSSAKNGNSPNQDKSLKVTVAMSRRGRELLRASDKFLNGRSSPKLQPRIPSPSLTFSLNTSVDSLASVSTIKTGKKSVPAKIDTRIKKKLTNGDSTAKKKTQAKLTKTVEKTARKPISTKLTKIIKPKTSETKLSSDLRMDGSSDSNFGSFMNLNSEEIQRQREAIMTDSFFQHLFLRDEPPIPSYNITPAYHNTTVLEKARLFQNYPEEHIINKYINTYLSHKKPVSESKFRIMEKFNDQRSRSPRSISWPGRMTDPTVKRLHYYPDIKTLQERSKSEPPHSKIVLSETTRPKSPTIVFKRVEKPSTIVISNRRHESPPAKIIFTQTSRPVSPVVFRKKQEKPVQIPRPTSPAKIIFTQTSRPVSPVVRRRSDMKQMSRSLSPGLSARQPDRMVFTETSRPVSPTIYFKPKTASDESLNRSRSHSPTARSPSCRRIQSARNYKGQEYINAVRKRVLRTRSAGDADTRLYRTSSNSSLHLEDYLLDPKLSRSRAERFRELNKFYSLWERAGELEKVTSAHDLRPRRKDKEIIDFDDWKQFRAKERAEEELERLYSKIKAAQDESDVLFYPKDPRSIKWDYQKDRNLYIKDKSVEDLRDHFQKYTDFDSEYDRKYDLSTDIYKPLWRGTSVINLASNLSKKDDRFEKHSKTRTKPTVITFKPNMTDLRHKLGIGSRLWSSLSMEQVNTLKNQLNAIYSKDSDTKAKRDSDASDQYVINVTDSMTAQPSTNLQVRCSSFTSGDQSTLDRKTDQIKADSISAINWQVSSEKDAKNVVNSKCQILSENEKKRISKSLSKEVLDRVKQKEKYPPILLARETRGATVSARIQGLARSLSETGSPRTCYSLEHSEDEKSPMKNGHVLVLTPSTDNKTNEEIKSVLNGWAKPVRASPASETETASSDFSNKTVIYRGSKEEVLKKIEYFEKIKDDKPVTATVYYPHDEEVAKEVDEKEKEKEKTADVLPVIPIPPPPPLPEPTAKKLVPSQSCSDFKELFGETEKYKYASLPIRIASPLKLRDESASPSRFSYISSTDSLFRSRSPSPDLERYWRAYLNIVKSGDVKRLKRRFESPSYYDIDSDFPRLRRHQSDPEIARSLLKKNWNSIRKITIKKHEYGDVDRLTHKYEASTRGRSRIRRGGISPIPKVPIRFDDRFMPHIDVISKLAALKRRSNTAPARSSYAGYPMECPVGEVGRIKTEFEKMSILGQMFTSAPDVHELRDIAPYLAGSWIAHKYPSRQDNNRTLDETGYVSEDRYSPVRKISERPKSASPVKLSSILKQDLPKSGDIFADQPFDPAMHRPISRYQPPPPPRPAWPEVMTTYTARPTVTFQEPEWSPTPSLKNFLYDSDYSPESPRRYVESDVNIHYRVPVVQEPRPLVPEHELARRQAEHMKRVYQEERRRKYLQELQDMNSRRHADNFTPSQKSPIPLHRYDDLDKYPADIPNKTLTRALYNFSGQNQKELTFKKGDLIILRRQVDPNWYEGEVNGRVGIFPKSYVETYRSPAPPSSAAPTGSRYGRARALYDFTAQTRLELPLKRGQLVALTRRIDKNWWEGRSQDGTTGIFPESYIEVLQEPLGTTSPGHAIMELTRSFYSEGSRPIGSPAAHSVIRGTGKQSMGGHHYTPQHNSPSLNAPGSTEPLSSARPIIPKAQRSPILPRAVLNSGRKSQSQSYGSGIDLNNTQPLYVDTNADAVPYRAMYKYRPQNTDELELLEGDTVYVLEKCDDGWYVGSSQRTGNFGTFPGNYVTKI